MAARVHPIAPPASYAPTYYPLYPVTTAKFVLLSISTFGLYELVWAYENWLRINGRLRAGRRVSPIWRTLLSQIYHFSLFRGIRDFGLSNGVDAWWNPYLLGLVFLVCPSLGKLPDQWGMLTLAASILALIPVQRTAQQINGLYAGSVTEVRNRSLSAINVIALLIGVIIWTVLLQRWGIVKIYIG